MGQVGAGVEDGAPRGPDLRLEEVSSRDSGPGPISSNAVWDPVRPRIPGGKGISQ
jgi:hypothetical protein